MNKGMYRLVYNKVRGELMAVAEFVVGHQNGSTPRPAMSCHNAVVANLRPLAFSLLCALNLVWIAPAHGQSQIIADPNASRNQQAQVLPAGNNPAIPVINIQTPNGKGVSRNIYSQFDVGQDGAVLNNAHTNQTSQSQLAGYVGANPNLAGGSARIILNEVNARDPSQLRGYIDVAGQKAQVVVANPAGITCDGCGFINANRATLTTGTPQFDGSGSLTGYEVNNGKIIVDGKGMDASRADQTDILARAVEINAGLWASELTVTTGVNRINADNPAQTEQRTASGDKPQFALDVSALGGMYAGKITLTGTENGVGVRNAGYIGASVGEAIITADGRLENSGTIYSTGSGSYQADTFINSGTVGSGGDLSITAGTQQHSGLTVAGLQADGNLASTGNLDLNASQRLTASGKLYAAGDMRLNSPELQLSGGTLSAGGDATLATTRLETQNSLLSSGANLSVSADSIDNRTGHWQSSGSISLSARNIDNTDGKMRAGADYALLSEGRLDNSGGLISGNGTVSLGDAGISKILAIENAAGTLLAGQRLAVDALSFTGSGKLLSQGSLRLAVDSDLDFSGDLTANGDTELTIGGTLSNSGQIQAGQHLTLSAASLDNHASGDIAAGYTDITTATLTNRGTIDGSLTQLNAGTLNNLGSGKIYGDNLLINTATLNNLKEGDSSAVIAARDTLLVGAGQIYNREHSLIYSGGDMGIGGHVDTHGLLTGSAALIDNASATIESLDNMQLSVDTLNNRNLDFATHVVEIERQHIDEYSFYPDRDGGPVYGSDDVYVDGSSADGLNTLHTPDGRGGDDYYQYDYQRVVTEEQILRSDPGQILAGGDMVINAGRVYNDKSEIVAGGVLVGNIAELVNTELKGERIQTDSGILHQFYRITRKGSDDQGHRTSAYTPAAVITEIDLQPTRWLGSTASTGSGLSVGENVITHVDGTGLSGISPAIPGIPDNGLAQQLTDPTASYYLESDPRFTHYRSWLSSDYMLERLATDPDSLHKRLGDGFLEQRMIREQVVKLTGQRFLDDYSSDEAQYRALIDSGVAFGQEYNLIPGVALTAEQMAALTSNMVWLVEQQVTLPDGSTVTALVPQVYILDDGTRQAPSSALIAGRNIDLTISGELTSLGTLSATESLFVDANAITNRGGNILANDLWLKASGDVNHTGGLMAGDNSLTLLAGGNINVASQTHRTEGAQGYVENISRVAEIRVNGSGQIGELTLIAGGDMTLTAAAISNRAEGGSTELSAENIRLNTVTESFAQNNQFNSDSWLNRSGSTETGTVIQAQGDITLDAARDIHARAASLISDKGDIAAYAGNDITIESGRRTDSTDAAHRSSGKSGGGNSVSLTLRDRVDQDSAIASQVSAENVILSAGRDITVTGSNVVATHDTDLIAGRNVTLQAAQESYSNSHYRKETKSGAFASGATVTFGSQSQTLDNSASGTDSFASTVGSLEGNVTVDAGGSYRQTGSHVNALEGDIGITAGDITLDTSTDAWRERSIYSFEQKGLTIGVSNPVISAIQTAQSMQRSSQQTDDKRMLALAGATTGLAAYNAGSAVAQNPQAAGGVNISITYGQSRSEEVTDTWGVNQTGSTVQAGGSVLLNANTRDGRSGSGNISVSGSDIRADNKLGLIAENDILLTAADNTNSLRRDSKSSSWGAGVGITVGKGVSAGFTANGSLGRGEAEGDDLWRTSTHLTAGDTLFLQSGGDTTLSGATAKGNTLIADVGKNLTIESLQDTSTYKSKDWNVGGSVTVGYGFSGSASFGQNKVDADFASVTEQSGLFAGDGGFNVSVGGHTDLTGAVIASSDKAVEAGKNRFSTGTFVIRDIENRSGYDASGFSIGGGFNSNSIGDSSGEKADGGSVVSKDQSGNATTGANGVPGTEQPGYHGWSATTPVVMSAKDNTSSSTRSGISGGEIIISNEADQQALTGQTAAEAIASLNRDVSSDRDGTNAIDNLYERDKEKIDAGFEITRAFQNEVSTFAVNKAREADELKKALEAQGIDPESNAEYQNALKWAPGGQYSQIITAISAATGSNVMGGFDQLAQAAVLNYVQGMTAQQIKKLADSIGEGTVGGEAARAVLQGLAACGAQAGQGGNCASAGLGTAAGVIANAVLNHLDKKPEEMSSEEKKAREDLITTLIAGAAAATGGDVGSAVASSQVEVENNSLGSVVKASEKALEACAKNATCRAGLNQMGISIGLTNAQVEEAMKAGATRDPARIAELTPEQIEYLDKQIKSGTGMAGLILGSVTWGDRLNLPNHTGGDQIVESVPTNTGGNQLPPLGPNHTGNNTGAPDIGNVSGTPIPEQPSIDDIIYQAEGTKIPKPGISGKEGAKGVPSWVKGERPLIGENGNKFAERLLDAKYGKGNYDKGPGTEFNQIRKWGDRSFIDPK